ncbi:MAG TPA: energy transducer TonB [Candidatus Acidoferrales bacterium]|jgi:protein TonB|nr:energy transducer TonB [Candidatus Acidoferrales bacterium]
MLNAMSNARADLFAGAVWDAKAKVAIRVPSSTEAQQTVLKALLDSPLREQHRNPLDFVVSIAVHAIVLAALVIAPLLVTQVIDLHALQLTYLVAPAPPAAAPPPAPVAVQRVAPRKFVPLNPAKLVAPAVIPQKVLIVHEPQSAPDVGVGVLGGIPGGVTGGVLGGIIGGTANVAPPPPVAHVAEKKEKQLLQVGGDVKPPRKVFAPAPRYPALAVSAHIHGEVLIEAIINEKGDVVNARAVQGPSLLIPEALKAVMQWKYEPTYLNGVPFPVEMTVTVNFSFAS